MIDMPQGTAHKAHHVTCNILHLREPTYICDPDKNTGCKKSCCAHKSEVTDGCVSTIDFGCAGEDKTAYFFYDFTTNRHITETEYWQFVRERHAEQRAQAEEAPYQLDDALSSSSCRKE